MGKSIRSLFVALEDGRKISVWVDRNLSNETVARQMGASRARPLLFDNTRLCALRLEEGLTQEALAEELEMSVAGYRNYESGRVNNPYFDPNYLDRQRILYLMRQAFKLSSEDELLVEVDPDCIWRACPAVEDERVRRDHAQGALTIPEPAEEARLRLEATTGAVPLESVFYTRRSADDELSVCLERRDCTVLIKGARQVGKTSLLSRGLQYARELGAATVVTDFQCLNIDQLQSAESLYHALADSITDQLELDTSLAEVWKPFHGANMNFEKFMRRVVLKGLEGHFVWGLDEIDRLISFDFATEVLGLFRSWHNQRSLNPGTPWHKLTLVMSYATEAHLFIRDVNQSPFNVGTRLMLEDFDEERVAGLNRLHGSPLRSQEELVRFRGLVGGHPYLVRQGLYELVMHERSLEELYEVSASDDGPFGNHLRRLLDSVQKSEPLRELLGAFARDNTAVPPDHFYRLRSGGILSGPSASSARFRCGLYRAYFERHLAG